MKVGIALPIMVVTLASATTAVAERPTSKRTVVFRDGAVPKIEVPEDRYVGGEVELELRFVDTNPLCFRYTLSGKAISRSAPARAQPGWNNAVFSSPEDMFFDDADAAVKAIFARMNDLGRVSLEATNSASLAEVWEACSWAQSPGRVLSAQKRTIETADATLKRNLGPNGQWTKNLRAAVDTLASIRRHADALQAAPGGSRASKKRLKRSADELEKYLVATLTLLTRTQDDVAHAKSLLASVPPALRRHYGTNRDVVIAVRRERLVEGRPKANAESITVSAEVLHTLPPILFDVGIGPAITFKNTQAYGLAVRGDGRLPNVVRTEDNLNIDGVLSISMYIWGSRYLDDVIFDPKQLLPRPMIGLSFRQPFSSIYGGVQIDPIQFLDLSIGARAYTTKLLVGPGEGDVAYTDPNGNAIEPEVLEGVTTQLFVSITASTDLFQRWIQRSF